MHLSKLHSRAFAYAQLMRLHRPIGILLLLWPTLWALWIAAGGVPPFSTLTIFVLGVIVMRSVGCVINDLADRHVDGHVARTRLRPLVTGLVSVKEACILLCLLCLLALILVFQLNHFTKWLSCIGLALAFLYPFMKRYTYWPQFFLGAAYAWAIPMAFAAQQQAIPPIALLLYGITLLWSMIYDTMYAMVDRDDDRKIGVKSTAILFGRYDRLCIAGLQVVMLVLLFVLGRVVFLGLSYDVALLGATGLFIYQQYLIRDRVPANCFQAFQNNQWVGLLIFIGIIL